MSSTAETAFAHRVSDDAVLIELVGTKTSGLVNLTWGWPGKMVVPTALPLITYYAATDDPQRAEIFEVLLRTAIWVWPGGDNGGVARLSAIDTRLVELLEGQTWTYESKRFYAIALSARTIPGPSDRPLRRTRDFRIFVSPGLPGT